VLFFVVAASAAVNVVGAAAVFAVVHPTQTQKTFLHDNTQG